MAQHSNDSDLSDSLRYDASGNITWRKQGLAAPKTFAMEATHNRLVKMTQPGADSVLYTYDDDGNRAKDDDFDPSGYVLRAYFYDALGRTNGILNRGTDPDGNTYPMGGVDYCWFDALGRQIKACGYGAPFLSLDGQSIIRAENWRIRQGPGLDDPLIALARNDSYNEGVNPKEIYYLTDGAGRHYAVADTNGSIAAEIWNETASVYLGFRATGAVTQSHSFGEERLSTERTPGLSYFRNRVYDQETGRWTQEDPIGIAGGINLYQFNGNDPATYDDPYGLCPPEDLDFGPHCPGYWMLLGEGAGAILGAVAGGFGGGSAGAVACSPAGPAAAVCVAAGGGLGASKGAVVGAAIGGALGAGVDWVLQFSRAGKARGDNAGPNSDVNRIVKEAGLNRAGRRALHDEITGKDLSLDEIRVIAEELAEHAKYIE